jgi:NADPH-dependent ferric siderophore reductase
MRPARVSALERLSQHFRFIDFEGVALRDCIWAPGQKIQIKLDGGLVTRTFTPIGWDPSRGATRILGYAHGAGPGSDWLLTAAPGTERQIFGPRRSMDLGGLPSTAVMFGDETSFGLAAALRAAGSEGCTVRHLFEVTSLAESVPILNTLGIEPLNIVERRGDDSHLADLIATLRESLDETAHFILSGKAQSIQQVSRALKGFGIDTRRLRTKAYWAPGKKALD